MADEKVSALATAGAYNDADILYIIQGGVSVKTTWGSIKTALRTAIEYPEVANYAALPAAADHNGEIYVCLASQGSVWLLTLKDSGFYLSDGSVWTRLGALPADYFTDSVLSIADDADPTKVVKFSCAAVATLTTRTFTWPDADGTVMLVGDAPTAHKTSHENGGGDEINVGGLSGVLADPQPPIIGATGTTAVAGNDARLTDERVPTAAGLTTKFGTNKATLVDGDKVAILDSEASDVPKYGLFSLVKSTLKTYFDSIYNAALSTVSQAEAEAGTATTVRNWTAERVAQAIAALGGGGGGGTQQMTFFSQGAASMAASAVYYIGWNTTVTNNSVSTRFRVPVYRNLTVKSVWVQFGYNTAGGDAGHDIQIDLVKNDGATSLGSTTATSNALANNVFRITGLSAALTTSENFHLMLTAPSGMTTITGITLTWGIEYE